MIDTIIHDDNTYPLFQSEGYASQFAIPYAKHFCKGIGIDVGCNREEWKFPGAIAIDPAINGFDALNFPHRDLDYVFSSHCLEHIPNWVAVLDYWTDSLKKGGVLFLYLPDYSQTYWRPWNNRKHCNIFSPEIIHDYMNNAGYKNVFKSGVDLNNSFMVVGEK
jgi:SAM-dependent methyltransferase